MSYDLFFRSRRPAATLDHEEFCRYFSGRHCFRIENSQAFYENADTGVYFLFEHGDPFESGEMVGEALLPIAFNLNFYRPHIFALEAEPEVAAFVKHFDLTVSDQQFHGMGDGDYSREGFLNGWNAGNVAGYQAFLPDGQEQSIFTLPSARIEQIWHWNLQRQPMQDELGDGAFVPLIVCVAVNGQAKSAAIWTDGIPILLPMVDLVYVYRQELAPRRLLGRRDDFVAFEWNELEPLLRQFPKTSGATPAYQLFYRTPPPAIHDAIRRKRSVAKPDVLSVDQVLDRELVEAAQSRKSD